MRDPQRFWDRIAKRYDKHGEKKRAKLLETIEYIKPHLEPGDRVLDFACGTGEKALGVAACVKTIHGVDLSPIMIEKGLPVLSERTHSYCMRSRISRLLERPVSGSVLAISSICLYATPSSSFFLVISRLVFAFRRYRL